MPSQLRGLSWLKPRRKNTLINTHTHSHTHIYWFCHLGDRLIRIRTTIKFTSAWLPETTENRSWFNATADERTDENSTVHGETPRCVSLQRRVFWQVRKLPPSCGSRHLPLSPSCFVSASPERTRRSWRKLSPRWEACVCARTFHGSRVVLFPERTPRPGDSFLLLSSVMTTLFNSNPDKISLSLSLPLIIFHRFTFQHLSLFLFFSYYSLSSSFFFSLSLHFSLSSSSLMCCQAHSQWPRANVWVRQRKQRRGRERILEFANIWIWNYHLSVKWRVRMTDGKTDRQIDR